MIYLNTSMRGVIISIGALFVTYWLFMFYYPVPEIGAGYVREREELRRVYRLDVPVGTYVERNENMGSRRTLQHTAGDRHFAHRRYHGRLSETITAGEDGKIGTWMFVFGSGFLLIGAILDMWMPINKSLWTVSYTLFMAGWALCIFGIFYFLIDAKGIKKWAYPLIVYGMNAIFVFVLSGVAGRAMGLWKFNVMLSDGAFRDVSIKTIITQNLFEPYFSPLNASLLHAVAWVSVMYLVVWVMYQEKMVCEDLRADIRQQITGVRLKNVPCRAEPRHGIFLP
jgi:predicted acyltransferase